MITAGLLKSFEYGLSKIQGGNIVGKLITIKIWANGYQEDASVNPDDVSAVILAPNCSGNCAMIILKSGYRLTCVDDPEAVKRCLGI